VPHEAADVDGPTSAFAVSSRGGVRSAMMGGGSGVAMGAIAVVTVVACRGGAPEATALAEISHASGSRLRARVVEADGVRAFLGWTDTKLGVPCHFETAEDSRVRCIPDGDATYLEKHGGPRIISRREDALPSPCMTDAANALRAERERYAITETERDYDPCYSLRERKRVRVYRAGEVDEIPSDPPGLITHHPIEVPPEEFVAAEIRTVDRGGRLAVRVAVSEDGALEVLGLFDRSRGVGCRLQEMGPSSNVAVCIPEDAPHAWMFSYFYGDATCASGTEIAYGYEECPKPELILVSTTCNVGITTVGPIVESGVMMMHNATDLACVPATGETVHSDGAIFYQPGPGFEPGRYGTTTLREVGSGRIQRTVWTNEAGEPLAATHNVDRPGWVSSSFYGRAALRDRDLGSECSSSAVVGGKLRCVPRGVLTDADRFYADEACTVEIVDAPAAQCDDPDPSLVVISVGHGSCEAETHALGGEHTGKIFRRDANDTCSTATRHPNRPRAFILGEKLPPDRLAAIEQRQE
jgi:hypothetical protein